MNIGVSTASFYPLETEEALEQLGKAGVKYTEIFFNALSELKPAFIDILEDILDNYGIKVTSVHPTMSLAESFMIFQTTSAAITRLRSNTAATLKLRRVSARNTL